jgi:hypothetical protein
MNNQDKDDYELSWWTSYCNNCCNTYDEDTKHYTYGRLMGLTQQYHNFILPNISVVDIGGGPTSMLLKCRGLTSGVIIDPIEYPEWTKQRYQSVNITTIVARGEDIEVAGQEKAFDEAWIYNCLQHTDDPELIIKNARQLANTIRIFEWIDIPPHRGHPQELKEHLLNKWLGGEGHVAELDENICHGKSYSGVFEV